MSFSYSPKIVTNGLILYLDAANANSFVSGSTIWNDLSRGGYNGVLTNGPTFNSGNGGSIVFDGINDYISIAGGGGLSGASNGTIDIWVKWISTTQPVGYSLAYGPVCARQSNAIFSNNIICLNGANPTTSKVTVRMNSSVTNTLTSTSNAGLDWVNIIITFSPTSTNLYFNSSLEHTTTGVALSSGNVPLTLGAWIDAGVGYSNSNIGCFKIYNRALSATEVLQNYNTTKTRFGR